MEKPGTQEVNWTNRVPKHPLVEVCSEAQQTSSSFQRVPRVPDPLDEVFEKCPTQTPERPAETRVIQDFALYQMISELSLFVGGSCGSTHQPGGKLIH